MSLKFDFTVAVAAADTDAIAALQTKAAAGNLTLAANTVGTGYGQMVTLTSSANLSGVNFTIEGTMPGDASKTISVTIAGPNNNTVEADYFGTVTRIYADASFTPNQVSAGWTAKGVSKVWPADVYQAPFNIGFGCVIVTGSPTFSV